MTGITSRIIQSGLLPLLRNASTTSSRLRIFIRFWPLAVLSSTRSFFPIASAENSLSSSLIASAPIPALKPLPCFSRNSRYSASVSSCFFARPLMLFGSVTT